MRSIGAIEANSGLFNYRPIKPFDTIVARAQLEILIHGIVYVILMIFVGIAGEEFEVTNIITLVISWLLLAILGCGVGLIFMVIGKLLPDTVKFCLFSSDRCIFYHVLCIHFIQYQKIIGRIFCGTP